MLSRLLDDGEGPVETQHLRGVRIALGEFRGAFPAQRPGVRGDRGFQDLHQIFSRFTRKALNSGVYALASPTKGVSALASQFAPLLGSASAETPTKPQWIGMPTWKTFWPSIVVGASRFVTSASTSILPRFERTRTRSPLLMLFWLASSSGISTKGEGCSPARSGTCCVT